MRAGTGGGIALVVAAALVGMLPVVLIRFPLGSEDALYHVAWSDAFARVLWDGTLLPRWAPRMNAGLGSPVFFFYPPLSYYVAAPFHLILKGIPDGAFPLRVAAPLLYALSGCGMFLLLRRLAGWRGAVAGAIAYLALPYHLFVLVHRGDFAEFAGYACLPFVLLGLQVTRERPLRGVLTTAISAAALAATHTITALVAAPLIGAYALLLAARDGRPLDYLARCAGAAALALGLAAFYLVPMLALKDLVRLPPIRFQMQFLLLSRLPSGDPGVRDAAWAVSAAMLAWFIVACIHRLRQGGPRTPPQFGFWAAGGLIYAVATTVLAQPVWALLDPLVGAIQFPFRLDVVLDLCCAITVGLLCGAAPALWTRLAIAAALVSAMAVNLIGVAAGDFYYRSRSTYWHDVLTCDQARRNFMPRTADWSCGDLVSPLKRRPMDVAWTKGASVIAVTGGGSRHLSVRVRTWVPTELYLAKFAFPGWQARVDDVERPLGTTPDGILWLKLGVGDHMVTLTLAPTPAELWGDRISLAAVLLWCALLAAALALPRGGPALRSSPAVPYKRSVPAGGRRR